MKILANTVLKSEYLLCFQYFIEELNQHQLEKPKDIMGSVYCGSCFSDCFTLSIWYAPNVPFLDDYHLCLDFLNGFVSSGHSIPVLLEKRNGHFFLTQKLIFLLDYLLFGDIDFRHFVVVNNVVFISVFYVIYRVLRNLKIEKIHFISLLLIGCVPNFYLNNHPSSFLHFSSVLLCLLTFLCLDRRTSSAFVLASFLAILAALSSGGGLLVYFAALPLVWKRFRGSFLLIWCLQFLMLVGLYLVTPDAGSGGDFSGIFRVSYWVVLSGNFFLFFGSFFKPLYGSYHFWSVIIGVGGIVGLMYMFWDKRKILKLHPLLLAGLLLGILLGLSSTIMRSQYGLGATTSDRYRLYQFIFWAFSYLFLVTLYKVKLDRWYVLILAGSILLYGLRMRQSMEEIQFRSIQLVEGMKYYQTFGDVGQLTYRHQDTAGRILSRSKELGIYTEENQVFDLFYSYMETHALSEDTLNIELSTFNRSRNLIHIEGRVHSAINVQDRDRILFFVSSNGMGRYYDTGPIITAEDWLPVKDNGFSVTVEGVTYEERIGVALYRKGSGVMDEQFVDLKSQ